MMLRNLFLLSSSFLHLAFLAAGFATTASDMPLDDGPWYSLSETMEFQPASRNLQEGEAAAAEVQQGYGPSSLYLDSLDTYYDPYQTAWRYLGFYIDCSPFVDYDDDNNNSNNNNNDNEQQQQQQRCRRVLMWAAYVDLDYQGGGTGEYQYFDPYHQEWDRSACELTDSKRCAKMNCHERSTHWRLLGFYKEVTYTQWFEQLFKHEGYCIWNNEYLYEFMYGYYNSWPKKCTQAPSYDEHDNVLYYEMKPIADGNMTIGLYSDPRCAVEYEGDLKAGEVLRTLSIDTDDDYSYADDDEDWNYGLLLGEYQKTWNEAMSIYKVCQPCRAYNLQVTYAQNDNNRNLEDANYSPNYGLFQCNDPADHTDVNQCMKFRTHTFMESASFEEITTAAQQGSLIETEVQGTRFGSPLSSSSVTATERKMKTRDRRMLWSSVCVLAVGLVVLSCTCHWLRSRGRKTLLPGTSSTSTSLNEPLVDDERTTTT